MSPQDENNSSEDITSRNNSRETTPSAATTNARSTNPVPPSREDNLRTIMTELTRIASQVEDTIVRECPELSETQRGYVIKRYLDDLLSRAPMPRGGITVDAMYRREGDEQGEGIEGEREDGSRVRTGEWTSAVGARARATMVDSSPTQVAEDVKDEGKDQQQGDEEANNEEEAGAK
ncbi:hypothetical protein IAR50_007280 [Cryptococcus sp. DSM 104548]